jgi:hypothetical protein
MPAKTAGQLHAGGRAGATGKLDSDSSDNVAAEPVHCLAAGPVTGAGRTRNLAVGPQAVQAGNSIIKTATPAQARCRAAAIFTRNISKTAAVPAATSADLTKNSINKCST